MKLISQIDITRPSGKSAIQLLQGDLSAIPSEHETDILAMSAFPNDYAALKGSLVYALKEKGLSMQALADDKETDLRDQLKCWLSKPLSKENQAKFNFKKILCFEPGEKIKEPDEIVGNIFRCINTFVFDDDNNVVAMPIIGTGYQQVPLATMLPALLEAAIFWLQNGLPLNCIKLVVHSDEQLEKALSIFNNFKEGLNKATPAPQSARGTGKPRPKPVKNLAGKKNDEAPTSANYDYFLSYAHKHADEIKYFVEQFKNKNDGIKLFYDRESMPPGGLWIQQISNAIENAEKVIVFLSPDYDNSPVCWDEFQCAKLMEYNKKKSIIQTVYLFGHTATPLPPIMGIYSYIDCREGNKEKIDACISQLLK